MRIKEKLRAFLQRRSGLGQHECQNTNDGKTHRTKKNKMAYKRSGSVTSKSMMDLSRSTSRCVDQGTQLQNANSRVSASHWNVETRGRDHRRKPPAPEPPPPRISVDPPAYPSVCSNPCGSSEAPSSLPEGVAELPRPKRVSSVQFAEAVEKETILEVEETPVEDDSTLAPLSRDHRSSTGSSTSTSTPITAPYRPPQSSGVSGLPGSHLLGAQSMIQLPRCHQSSLTSDDEPKPTKKRSSALHALKNLSRSTPAMSPSASPRHSDSEGPPRVSKGTKKFMRHFADAPPSERVLNYFACALVSDILLQGTLYITPNYFAFYSKIFGHVSRLLIPISQVASVQKERTAKIIPNAVGLQTIDGKSYVFGSLLSRDSTYKLMTHLWKKAQMIQDSDSEPPSGVPGTVEDDCDDSGSGSGESFADEDQPDGGGSYLASAAITTLTGVASSAAAPWTSRDPSAATTMTTTSPTAALTSSSSSSAAAVASTLTSTLLTSPNIVASGAGNTIALSSINEAAAVSLRRDSLTATKSSLESTESEDRGLLGWLTEGTLVKTCCRMGSIPLRLIGDAMREIWALPRTSLLLLISTMLLLMLFASAAFMLHRVDVLSQQLGLEKYDEYDGMYEEVLQMQQRLHAAASSEIEKTLSIQLKHIATVRQSLEALVVLFNKEPPVNTARIPDNT
ncbi:uncharacterized protein [Macrobrachium rosenbergii]|uniref:uncharacterized protein n=1 Tax=Macrobrachium rosenbergii TaxID=79674 RepID=UPI0034D4EB7F